MYTTRAFKSRVRLTPAQEQKCFAASGVRKFAFNDFVYRRQYDYAIKLLQEERTVKNIFDLTKIASVLGFQTSYSQVNNEWVFALSNCKGNKCELRTSTHGSLKAKSGKEHPKPDAGFAWLKEQAQLFNFQPDATKNPKLSLKQALARVDWTDGFSVPYKEGEADARKAFHDFFKGKKGHPRFDNGNIKRWRAEPGAAQSLGTLQEGESHEQALVRLNGDYVQESGQNHDGPPTVYKNKAIEVHQDQIKVPILGWVKLRRKGYLPTDHCKYIGVAFSKRGKYWYVSLTVSHYWIEDKLPRHDKTLGNDKGHRHLMVDSDGKTYGKHRDLDKEAKLEKRIARLNRSLVRMRGKIERNADGSVVRDSNGKKIKKIPSKRYMQTLLKLSQTHEKLTNMRNDLRHKATRRLVNKGYACNSLDKINVQDMLRKIPTTATARGKRLRKINSKVGYYELDRQIVYKSKWANAKTKAEEPHYTSKQCYNCGDIDFNLGSKEYIQCKNCGFGITRGTEIPPGADLQANHRDFNSARTNADPDKWRAKRDLAWAERHTSKVPGGTGDPTAATSVKANKGKRGRKSQKQKLSSDSIAASSFVIPQGNETMIVSNADMIHQPICQTSATASAETMSSSVSNDSEYLSDVGDHITDTARKVDGKYVKPLVSGETECNG